MTQKYKVNSDSEKMNINKIPKESPGRTVLYDYQRSDTIGILLQSQVTLDISHSSSV